MEPTEFTEPTEPILPAQPQADLVLGAEAKYFLHTAGRWASFLGILGFIGTGLLVVCGLCIGTILSLIAHLNPLASAMPAAATGVFTFYFLLIALFYFFMSYYLYQFGASIKNGTKFNDPVLAAKAFKNLKSHFKLLGITAIVFISLYIVGIIGVFVAFMTAGAVK